MFWHKKEVKKTVAEIAAENEEQHRSFLASIKWDTFGGEPEMIKVYTDQGGINYYVARNSWQGVSRDRLAALEAATLAMEYRFTREALMENQRSVMDFFQKCKEGDLEAAHKGYSLAWEAYEVMRTAPSEQVLLEYAVHLIYTDGENPQELSPTILKEKRDRAKEDIGLRAFFLDMSLAIVNASLPNSNQGGRNFTEKGEYQKAVNPTKKRITKQQLETFMKPLK